MSKDDQSEAAHRVAKATASKDSAPPSELSPREEEAWSTWIAGVGRIDERALNLLRAAFEAGVDAARGLSGESR